MKKAAEYQKKLKQLFNKLKKQSDKVAPAELDEPMELLLFSILSNYSSEARAAAAVSKLTSAIVDYNELRVTPVAEIVEIIGKDYPHCRLAGEEIRDALHGVFNHLHDLNLQFLKAGPKRQAESFVSSIEPISPHARAMMTWRCLGGRVVPLDSNMYAYLVKNDYLPEDVNVEDAQKFLASKFKDREGEAFYLMLKRFAATHAPRKTSIAPKRAMPVQQPVPAATAEPEPEPVVAARKPARSAKRNAATAKPKPKTTSKKTPTTKKTASKKPQAAPTKTKARKTRRKTTHK